MSKTNDLHIIESKRLQPWLASDMMLIAGLAFFKLMAHLLTNANYELHRDVYLYLALAEHPAWGYISVPPLTPMIGKLAMALFGGSAPFQCLLSPYWSKNWVEQRGRWCSLAWRLCSRRRFCVATHFSCRCRLINLPGC